MNLSSKIKTEIKNHARSEAPRECCGFIMSDQNVYRAENASQDENKFKISPRDFVKASETGEIKAVYHSHPKSGKPIFSEFDKFNSINHEFIYILYSMKNNSFAQFDPALTSFNKYIGREFKIGKTDCFSLCRDFYKFELNIEVNAPAYDENWSSHLEDLFDKYFEKEGFRKVNELQKYDCILFSRRKGEPSNHVALYLGDGLILHQPQKSYSKMEEYTSTHKKLTNYIIRHKQWAKA